MENNESFEYTYSAPEREEIRAIRDKYLPKDPRQEKLARLRQLDASVTRVAAIAAIALGTVSTLVFGIGLCLCLRWSAYAPRHPRGAAGDRWNGSGLPGVPLDPAAPAGQGSPGDPAAVPGADVAWAVGPV